jgi:glycosyltransferase involved in cell wall biosynthesis
MKSREEKISIIIPVVNEEGNIVKLHQEIIETFEKHNLNGEIIFIDDGSSDKTVEELKKLSPVKVIIFRKNFGQTAAMDAGIKSATGEIIVTMDGDGQNDPSDIPRLLDKIDEGLDVVSGWRKNRKDSWSKKFLSRGADKLRKYLINDQINDSGCSLKAYKKECFDDVDLYGEMHRFIPAILKIQGFKIGEIVVNHRPRFSGNTKYNYKRLLKGFLDTISVWFWGKFSSRPLHLFGGLGFFSGIAGVMILIWMAVERIFFGASLESRIWPMIGVFMILIGIQLFISGLLADISIKTYHRARNETPYKIKERIENN